MNEPITNMVTYSEILLLVTIDLTEKISPSRRRQAAVNLSRQIGWKSGWKLVSWAALNYQSVLEYCKQDKDENPRIDHICVHCWWFTVNSCRPPPIPLETSQKQARLFASYFIKINVLSTKSIKQVEHYKPSMKSLRPWLKCITWNLWCWDLR